MRPVSTTTIALALFVAACSSKAPSEADGLASEARADVGAFSGATRLMDKTDAFPKDKPSGGWYVTPIHASLLPSGEVLLTGWSRAAERSCSFPAGSRRNGVSFVLDPAQLKGGVLDIEPIDEAPAAPHPGWSPDVLYCAGHVPIVKDGRTEILLTGGSRYQNLGVKGQERETGLEYARRFLVDDKAFVRVVEPMQGGPSAGDAPGGASEPMFGWRWYPTNTRLPDGRVLVSGGFTGGPGYGANLSLEIFDPASDHFTVLSNQDSGPIAAEVMAPGLKDYTHTFLLPKPVRISRGGTPTDYELALIGWRGQILLATADPRVPNERRFSLASSRPGGAPGWDSTAALLPSGEILVMGGSNDPAVAQSAHVYDPQRDAWASIDTRIGRRNAASVLLPDGRVLLVNGWDEDGNLAGDRRRPQLLDPVAQTVETDEPWSDDRNDRGYHSFALLLKDGRVLIGGGIYPPAGDVRETDIGCERTDVRIYTPPYLRAGRARPALSLRDGATMKIGGEPLDVTVRTAHVRSERGVALMALGSFTHGFDQNQRNVPLEYQVSGDEITVHPPADANAAPPGDYLLFVIAEDGTPSVGVHVRLER